MTAWSDGRRETLRLAETKTTVASNHPARRSSPTWTSAHPPRRPGDTRSFAGGQPNIRTIEPRPVGQVRHSSTHHELLHRSTTISAATAQSEGVHALLDFPGVIMTDSGTFQSYVYGDVEVGMEEIVAFQRSIGVDIAMMLDVFSPDMKATEVEDAVRQTDARAAQSLEAAQDTMLNGPVQGGVQRITPHQRPALWCPSLCCPSHRWDCARHGTAALQGLCEDHDGHPSTSPARAARPHVWVRPTMLFPMSIAGADLFDSAAYALFARDGRLLTPWGTERTTPHRLAAPDALRGSTNTGRGSGIEAKQREELLAH